MLADAFSFAPRYPINAKYAFFMHNISLNRIKNQIEAAAFEIEAYYDADKLKYYCSIPINDILSSSYLFFNNHSYFLYICTLIVEKIVDFSSKQSHNPAINNLGTVIEGMHHKLKLINVICHKLYFKRKLSFVYYLTAKVVLSVRPY